MAFVVVSTIMSFTLDIHYCGNSLIDFSFFSKAESCGMEADSYRNQLSKPCQNPSIDKKSCCSDQKIVKEGGDDLKLAVNNLIFEQQTFVATFFYTYVNLFEGLDENIVPFKDYSPPFIERDVQILYETYLI
ncbi:MAG: hypothetical protein ABGW97_01770 [Christiangramia sp.]|nr:hypothetical protein [Christiangramia flava]